MSFIPDLPVLVAYSLASLLLFLTPGPDMSLWLARTFLGGRRAGMSALAGTQIGCGVHSLLAALGISALINAAPVAFGVMKVAGALYLLLLGIQMVRHGTVLLVEDDGRGPRQVTVRGTLATGILTNLTNPKVLIFFITFLPGFVSASDPNVQGKLLFLGLYFVVVNFTLAVPVIIFADRFVGVLKRNPAVLRAIDWTFAGVFAVFAVTILRTQARV